MIEMSVQDQLLRFVATGLLSGEACGLDDDLLSDGMVDSVGVVRIAVFLSEEYGITVKPEDFTLENFQSVAAIASYVGGRLKSQNSKDAA